MLTYNQNGTSRGIASIVFSKPDTAGKAAKDLNGLLVDGRPMKVSFVWTATRQAFHCLIPFLVRLRLLWMRTMLPKSPLPSPSVIVSRKFPASRYMHRPVCTKPRNRQNKSQPKPATAAKPAGAGKQRGRRPRGRNTNRPKPKTAEELDADMVDYFAANENSGPAEASAPVNGNAQPQTNGGGEDTGMAEISVSLPIDPI